MLTAVFHDVAKGEGAECVVRFTDDHPTDVPAGTTVVPILLSTVKYRMLHRASITISLKQHNKVLKYKSGDAPKLIRDRLVGLLSNEYKILGYILVEESQSSSGYTVEQFADKGSGDGDNIKIEKEDGAVKIKEGRANGVGVLVAKWLLWSVQMLYIKYACDF